MIEDHAGSFEREAAGSFEEIGERLLPADQILRRRSVRDAEKAAEYERLRELTSNREVKAMEMTWAEQLRAEYTREGIQQGIEQEVGALRRVVLRLLRQRMGAVPEDVQRHLEAIASTDPLEEVADKILDGRSVEEMGLR